jgi:hypothetical protein
MTAFGAGDPFGADTGRGDRFLFGWSTPHPQSNSVFEMEVVRRSDGGPKVAIALLGPDGRPRWVTQRACGSWAEAEETIIGIKRLWSDQGCPEPRFRPWPRPFDDAADRGAPRIADLRASAEGSRS